MLFYRPRAGLARVARALQTLTRAAPSADAAGTRLARDSAGDTPMAMPHAQALDVINVRPLGEALIDSFSTSLIRTERIQLLHLVLPARHDVPEHSVVNECVIHCLEGDVEVVMPSGSRRLEPGQLVVLPG